MLKYFLSIFLLFTSILQLFCQSFVKKTIDTDNKYDASSSISLTGFNSYLLSVDRTEIVGNLLITSSAFVAIDSIGSINSIFLKQGDSTSLKTSYDWKVFGKYYFTTASWVDSIRKEWDLHLSRTNSDGSYLTSKVYNFGPGDLFFLLFFDSSDSSLLLLGNHYVDTTYTTSQIVLAKFDTLCNLLKYREYGNAGFDFPTHLIQQNDGSLVICGYTSYLPNPNNLNNDIFLMKLDTAWNPSWVQFYGSANSWQESGNRNSMVMTSEVVSCLLEEHI